MTSPQPKLNPAEIVATLREVTVTYDGYQTRALSRVDLDFRQGLVTGVLGVKGAGKSTVLKVLAGRLGPAEGKVKVFGRSPRGVAKSRVGYLPGKADSNRPPGFVDRLLGRKKEATSAARGVARLAQAMLGNRDLLVLDDPFADLEPAESAEVKALIWDMVSRGKTVVLSSDSLIEVKDLCDRLVILDDGKIQAAGTLTELLVSGSAIRFLPAVLPKEIVERVLGVLREEILASGPSAFPASANAAEDKPDAANADGLLATMTKQPKTSGATETKADDAIDHGKLEELTKIKKPE
jgi:ABC-2 type transport system ATP-binding protein